MAKSKKQINVQNLFKVFTKATFAGIIDPILLKITNDKIVSKMSENSSYSIIEIDNNLISNMAKDEIDLCFLSHKNTLKYFEFIKELNADEQNFDLQIFEDRIIVSDKKAKIEVFVSDMSVVENSTLTTYNEEMFKMIYEETYSKFIKNWLVPLKAAPGKFVYFTCRDKELFISVEDEETLSNKIEIKIENLESDDFRFKFPKTVFKILNIVENEKEVEVKLNKIIPNDDLVSSDFGILVFEKRTKDATEIYGHISISD